MLGGVNALHTAFPENAEDEYLLQGSTAFGLFLNEPSMVGWLAAWHTAGSFNDWLVHSVLVKDVCVRNCNLQGVSKIKVSILSWVSIIRRADGWVLLLSDDNLYLL